MTYTVEWYYKANKSLENLSSKDKDSAKRAIENLVEFLNELIKGKSGETLMKEMTNGKAPNKTEKSARSRYRDISSSTADIKKLSYEAHKRDVYRVRSGNVRVIYTYNQNSRTILVIDIFHRNGSNYTKEQLDTYHEIAAYVLG